MSYHTVDVDCHAGTLTSQNGQMALISNEAKKSLPIEDISSVIVNGFDITIHKNLLLSLVLQESL